MVVLPPLPPTLHAAGMCLRGLRPSDAPALLGYLGDPAVYEHTSIPVPTPELIARALRTAERGYANGTSCKLAITLPPDDRPVGSCGFTNWSLDHEWAELAYDLARSHWGRCLASRAVAAVLGWAFHDAGFRRVHAVVMTSNDRSIRLLERAGFHREGTLRSYRLCRGVARDFYMYSLLSADWAARVERADHP